IVVDFGARPYMEEATKPRVPARAAQAQAASDDLGGAPRQANKIEVNLKTREPAPGKLGSASASGKQGSAPASQDDTNHKAPRQSAQQPESRRAGSREQPPQ